jgi:hypothetical protein
MWERAAFHDSPEDARGFGGWNFADSTRKLEMKGCHLAG